METEDGTSSPHSLDGLVIGERPHIRKRLAPFARALVMVYESARYSDREFSEEEYNKYMNLLRSVVYRCDGLHGGQEIRYSEAKVHCRHIRRPYQYVAFAALRVGRRRFPRRI